MSTHPPRIITAAGATPPADFIGRERELREIRERFEAGRHTLALVNAEGGMGKTTLAAEYWKRFEHEYQHLAWLYCDQGIAYAMTNHLPTPLNLIEAMNQSAGEPEKQIRHIVTCLANLPKPCLLVLDNANNPEHIRGFEQFCAGLGWHILITSRCSKVLSDAQCEYAIKSLPPEEARALFRRNYVEHDGAFDALLERFLTAVGYNTLCIEIFSKTLREGRGWGLDMDGLLQKLENNGLKLDEESFQIRTKYTHNVQSEAATSDQIMATLYDVNKLPPESLDLLTRFCLLPAESHTAPVLSALLAPDDKPVLKRGLEHLVQHGWISEQDGAYRVSPVVQKIVLDKNAARRWELGEGMVQRLNAIFETEGYHSKNINTAAPFEALVFDLADNLGVANKDLAVLFDQLWVYYTATGNLAKALAAGERIKVFCEKIDFKNGLAISYEKLGETYKALGNLSQALTFFEKNIELSNELHVAFPQIMEFKNGLAISYEKLGSIHATLGNLPQALDFFEERNRLSKELHVDLPKNVKFKNGLAISYEKLGSIHATLGNLSQALDFFEKYSELVIELHIELPQNVELKNNLAISYEKLGNTHTALGNLSEALTFFEKDFELSKELHTTFPQNVTFKNGLAISYEKLGNTHTTLGDLSEALTFFEKFNLLEKELHDAFPQNVSFKNGLAISYAKLGSTHTALGNLSEALTFFENYNRLGNELHAAFPQNVEFKNNLAISYEKLGNTHTALGNLLEPLACFEKSTELMKELHAAFPQNVDFKNGLAISYQNLGNTCLAQGNLPQALDYYEKYHHLENELYAAFPQNVNFKNLFAVSCSKLGRFYHTHQKDPAKAKAYFQQCFNLWQELTEGHPDYVEFRKNYEWAKKMLEQ